jgi:uncharacterized protein with HEPN domain
MEEMGDKQKSKELSWVTRTILENFNSYHMFIVLKIPENRDYFRAMVDWIIKIEAVVNGGEYSSFKADRKTILAVRRDMEVIGEAAKNIARVIRKKYPEIPGKDILGMRDQLIQGYWGIDLDILGETIQQDLPPLKIYMSKVIEEDLEK